MALLLLTLQPQASRSVLPMAKLNHQVSDFLRLLLKLIETM